MSCGHSTKTKLNKAAVDSVLTQFHQAAADADGKTYFSLFAKEGIFMGTDATERWTVKQFKKYAMPYFSKGKGWTYTKQSRNIYLSDDLKTAWFDETLSNKSYGECRGTGALKIEGGHWKITQYNLTIPMPNDLTKGFVKQIRKFQKKK